MHDEFGHHLTPETLKEMSKMYSSKMFKTAASIFFITMVAITVLIVLNGCATTPSIEQTHCGNSVKTILCKNPM